MAHWPCGNTMLHIKILKFQKLRMKNFPIAFFNRVLSSSVLEEIHFSYDASYKAYTSNAGSLFNGLDRSRVSTLTSGLGCLDGHGVYCCH